MRFKQGFKIWIFGDEKEEGGFYLNFREFLGKNLGMWEFIGLFGERIEL